jgi:hypothetical protein
MKTLGFERVRWMLAVLLAGVAAAPGAQTTPDLYADTFESAQLDVEVTDIAGQPLAGVAVGLGTATPVLTAADGTASLTVGAGATQVVRFTRAGYTDQFKPLYFEGRLRRAFLRAQMMPRATSQVVNNIQAGAVVNGPDGVVLSLPPNALVGPGGAPVTGTVTVSMTPVDVSGVELGAFPGRFEGYAAGGALGPIVSAGTVEYLITQGGAPVQLASGVLATLDLPVYPTLNENGAPVAAGQVIPLWYLDEASGLWRQQGQSSVLANAASPSGFVARGTVSHLSWWNLDHVPQIGFLRVRGFAPAGYAIAPNVTAFLAAVSIGGGPSSIATTSFAADTRSLPLPVPANRDIAIGLCTYVEASPPVPGQAPRLACGSATANVAPQAVQNVDVPLTLADNDPIILGQPADRTVLETRTAQFIVAAQSPDGSTLRYQWRRNDVDIATATAASYTTPPTVLTDDGTVYTVLVSNDSGSVTSNPATLHVTAAPVPTIALPPGSICTRDAPIAFRVDIPSSTSADSILLRRRPAPNGVFVTIGTDSATPFEFTWNTGAEAEGDYLVSARASLGSETFLSAEKPARIDRSVPTIAARSPVAGSQGEAPVISFTMSEPVEAASLVDASITLLINGAPAARTLALSANGLTVTITPTPANIAGAYQVTAQGLADCAGNVMAPDTWSFEALSFLQFGAVVNGNEAGDGRSPAVAYDGSGVPWVSYVQNDTGTASDRVLVKRWMNNAWTQMGPQLNTTPAAVGGFILTRIAIDNTDRPVVAYLQVESGINKLYVRRLEGAQWVLLGGANLNVTSLNAQNPVVAIGDINRPIVAWSENNQIRVKRYDNAGGAWATLGPATVAFTAQVALVTLAGVPYLGWGEFTSQSGNATNYSVKSASYDEATQTWPQLISDFRSTIVVPNAALAVPTAGAPFVVHGELPFVVSGTPQPADLRVLRRTGGTTQVVAASFKVDPNGLPSISDADLLGSSLVVAFNESVRDPMTGNAFASRIWVRVQGAGGFSAEPVTITGATELGNPDIAVNPALASTNGRIGIVFTRSAGRIAFKIRP